MNTDNRTNEVTDEQVEAAAEALASREPMRSATEWENLHEFERSGFRESARAALEAAGVVSQEVIDDLVFRAAAAIAETQARRQNLPPEVIQGVTREHMQDAKAALTAAGVAPQVPSRLPGFFAPKPMPNSYVPAPVLPSSGDDEAVLIREAKAEALEEFADQMATGFNPQTLNAERRAIKREARARAAEIREGKNE